jgi:hypothetical protein
MHVKSVTFVATLLLSAHAAAMTEKPVVVDMSLAKEHAQFLITKPTPSTSPLVVQPAELVVAGTACKLFMKPHPLACN